MLDQVLAPLDKEHARLVEGHLEKHGMRLVLGDGVSGFAQLGEGQLEVSTKSGKKLPADLVILALGVRPETVLAKTAGLAIGERGGILVDDQMRTSDPRHLRRRRRHRGEGLRDRRVEPRRARGAREPAGPHRRRRDRGPRLALPRHAGHVDHRPLRRRGGVDRRLREDAPAARRHGLREDLPPPELARGLLPGREAAAR